MEDNVDYFIKNASKYITSKPYPLDYDVIDFIEANRKHTLLDVGGGSGTFASLVKDNFPDMDVFVIDPAKELLKTIKDNRINKSEGKLPNELGLDPNIKFDYIHIKEVLHHIVGYNINNSKILVKKSICNLKDHLNASGILFIHDVFYEGFLFPTFPRDFIFYSLYMQNKINLKIPLSEFILGLNVCFYTRKELQDLITSSGLSIIDYKVNYWGKSLKRSLLSIDHCGEILFIVRK